MYGGFKIPPRQGAAEYVVKVFVSNIIKAEGGLKFVEAVAQACVVLQVIVGVLTVEVLDGGCVGGVIKCKAAQSGCGIKVEALPIEVLRDVQKYNGPVRQKPVVPISAISSQGAVDGCLVGEVYQSGKYAAFKNL